ncbi:MAG: D-amino-acid oxidase, partial [Rhodanobacteraceae bacterium]
MQRRQFLRQAGVTLAVASTAGVAACARQPVAPEKIAAPPLAARLESGIANIAPIRAQADRITGVYVCT